MGSGCEIDELEKFYQRRRQELCKTVRLALAANEGGVAAAGGSMTSDCAGERMLSNHVSRIRAGLKGIERYQEDSSNSYLGENNWQNTVNMVERRVPLGFFRVAIEVCYQKNRHIKGRLAF